MGSEPYRIKGKAAPDTMIQKDTFSDRTKLIFLAVFAVVALLGCFASTAGH